MSQTIYIQNARISFAHIAEPHQSGPNSPLKYSADLLLELSNKAVAELQAAALKLATEVWADQAQTVLQYAAQESRTRSFGDGNTKIKQATMQPYDGYAGMFFVTANNDLQPQIIKADGSPVDPTNTMELKAVASQIYSGCRVNAAVSPWPQNNQHGRCIRWNLIAVQFAADDQPFGEAKPDASGLFGAVQTGGAAPSPAGLGQPMAPPVNAQQAAPSAAPVLGPDGQWHDPVTGAVVQPPAMPGYPQ